MFVYLIQSIRFPERQYVGCTSNFEQRLAEHNDGKSTATYKFRPWKCITRIWFKDPKKAALFEIYLKSGSGRAFASRHLW